MDGREADEMAMKDKRKYKVDVNGESLPYQHEARSSVTYHVDDFKKTRKMLSLLRDSRQLDICWSNINFFHVRENEDW